MPDDKTIKHPLDGKRIDINDPDEVRNWCDILGVDETTLKKAVRAVGTSAVAIRKYLGR